MRPPEDLELKRGPRPSVMNIECLQDFPLVISFPVLWGDTDSLGHVNNTVYLRWCETARIEYLAQIGMWPPDEATGIGPILASIKCDYRKPVYYPGTVAVGSRVVKMGRSSLRMDHRIISEGAAIAAEVESTLVLFDYRNSRAVPLPNNVRAAIEEIERDSQ